MLLRCSLARPGPRHGLRPEARRGGEDSWRRMSIPATAADRSTSSCRSAQRRPRTPARSARMRLAVCTHPPRPHSPRLPLRACASRRKSLGKVPRWSRGCLPSRLRRGRPIRPSPGFLDPEGKSRTGGISPMPPRRRGVGRSRSLPPRQRHGLRTTASRSYDRPAGPSLAERNIGRCPPWATSDFSL